MLKNRNGVSVRRHKVRRPEYHTRRWRKLRLKKLVEARFTCQKCHDPTAERLELHHIVPTSEGGAFFDPENTVVVCLDCHLLAHGHLDLEQIEWRKYVRDLC